MKLLKFKSRPANTLLLIAPNQSFRVDCDRKGIFLNEAAAVDVGCRKNSQLGACIGEIAAKGTSFGRRIWIFYANLPLQLLSLPAAQVEGIDAETLIQALQFEMEGVTGQPAFDNRLSYRTLGAKDELIDYLVCQIGELEFDDLNAVVRKAGSRLGGLLHPGALPRCIGLPESGDWLRIESWPEQLLAIRVHPEEGESIRLFSSDRHARTMDLQQWLTRESAARHTESLINFDIDLLPDTDTVFDLADQAQIAVFLNAWADLLFGVQDPAVPVISPKSKFDWNVLAMAGGGALALFVCTLHLVWNLHQANRYEGQTERLKVVEQSMGNLRKEITKLQDQRDELKKKQAKIDGDSTTLPTLLGALKQRPAQLLYALSKGSAGELVIESIETREDTVIVHGVTLIPSLANELTGFLSSRLTGLGWEISSPTKENMGLLENGGPWRFELLITDLGLDGFMRQPAGEKS
ncbi:MAG: hypothetical protein ACU833_10690 [Gammaproteobacteria bacterium]